DKGVMLILRGVNMNDADHPEDMVSLRIWIDPSRIITVVRREVKAANDIRQKIIDGTGPKNAADFLTALTTRLFERIDPVITELDEDTDNIEESIMESPDVNIRHDINEVRKKAIMLRRYIAPQREVITRLRTCELKWLDQIHRRYFQENLDRLTRYTEDLDAIRERAQIVKDELTNILSDRLNKNMYILSIVAAIFLPLGFFTGLLGINVGGIPGADNEYAFYIFCTTLTIIVILQIWIFRKLKWI
ncbi:MAG: zinc transporter ZntB, partial [Alphaproteobacteria bacterium CG11_big_fil_rev_8_21_14_0_20_44_7]